MSTSKGSDNANTETILLVEDEPLLRELANEFLTAVGYTVVAASGAEEALQWCRQNPGSVHLLLVDIMMPHTTGPVLAEQITEIIPNLKVLFMSGYPDGDAAFASGVEARNNFLQKPFTAAELNGKIREVLDSH